MVGVSLCSCCRKDGGCATFESKLRGKSVHLAGCMETYEAASAGSCNRRVHGVREKFVCFAVFQSFPFQCGLYIRKALSRTEEPPCYVLQKLRTIDQEV